MAYRAELKNAQAEITAAIERKLGQELDVVWNLTLAANLISANVKFGQIKAIEQVAGVKEVLIETRYEPDTAEQADPNTASSAAQIGSAAAWAYGYTGAGSRIAIIDTGSDSDHQSLNATAFEYALGVLAQEKGLTYEEYVASLDLLDAEEIQAVAADLNAPVSAEAYINSKLPFGYNYIDKSLTIGDLMIVYNEMLEGQTGVYSNLPFTTIAGAHEYVFIDGIGSAENWAAVGDALKGKIAICSRGEISFFEKAQFAVEAGAIATFIYNNDVGVINMDLSDYKYTQPCASLTMADGAAIKAASTPVTDDAGNVLYYTGTMNISDTMGIGQFNSAYYTMSSFSSWGVPGSLELKPEITAPGGNIYSINGVDTSAKGYEVMSGTSIAAPQVAGMAAVVAQYIRENGLENQTGLSARQLAQSLLMSTAVPMLDADGSYYPVIQQGSGLANVGAAVSADSYITMAEGSNAGAADGKVKVELGDDPSRDGVYTATFTINNLTDEELIYELGADFFIQAPTSDGVDMYMYTATDLIGANVAWTVDGVAVEPAKLEGLDFNGDALVNADDGQILLDYATGLTTELTNMDKADLDADGDIDSRDAYLFLSAINAGVATVEANGSATVTLEITLGDMWKNTINYYYPNGTYIQGYIFAESLPSAEGVMGTSHSIPVLGFFGNLSTASEGDVVSIGLTLAPEYYVDAEGNVNWDAPAEGATLGGTAVIDNTAPTILDVSLSLMTKALTVTVTDNQYVAGIALYNKAGTEVLAYYGSGDATEPMAVTDYLFSLENANGTKFLVQVFDYAMNTTTYMIETGASEEQELPGMIAFDLAENYWTTFDTEFRGGSNASSRQNYYAATIVDHMVLAASEDGILYIMPETDLTDVTCIASAGTILLDMAYNAVDDTVYAVDLYGQLVSVDRLTAEVEVIGEIGVATNTLACDNDGTFYCNGFGTGAVYTFTLDTVSEPAVLIEDVGISSKYVQSMECDPNNGLLYWASYSTKTASGKVLGFAYLYEIDPTDGSYKQGIDLVNEIAAMIIPTKGSGSSWTAPTDKVSGIKLSQDSASVLKGGTLELTAAVLPWTATDRTVTWTSDNEAVATVDENGVVTAISAGTAVITATSNLDASFTASCELTVNAMEITINGTLQDAQGNPFLYSWNMHVVDPVSGASESVVANAAGVPLWDMVYSEFYSTESAPKINGVYYYYLLPVKDPTALDTSAFGLSSYLQQFSGASYLTAVASAGYEQITSQSKVYDSEHIMMLDNAGFIWSFWVYPSSSGYGASLNYYPTDLELDFPGYDNDMYCSMVVGEDGNLYLSAFNGSTNELYRLVYDETADTFVSTYLGNVGADVWPATITSVTNNGEAPNALPAYESIATIHSAPVSAAELAAAADACTINRVYQAPAAEIESETAEDETTVTIDVTAEALANNGVVEVNWDTEILELAAVIGSADYTATRNADGSVTYGFVDLDGIEAGANILSLTFNVLKKLETTVTVNQKQINAAAGETREFIVNEGCVPAPEVTVVAEGWSGYTTWVLTSDGTLTFSPTDQTEGGQTNLKNYWKVGGVLTLPWGAYADMITTVVIADGIHDVGQMAFYELKNLTTVKLGADVTEIRNYAFKNCTSLTTINLENVDYIREGAFFGCSALENVTLGAEVVIEDWAFTQSGVTLN